ncbi:DUF309 domain-containing protein [Candidatus Woesearchaeota archaeon]|nr:DUF309 domain-containing protein [Candidatus Woesearchaeota archaeon]
MDELFRQGIEHFNSRQFFEAHNSWEKIWLNAGKEKKFLQGLIQIAVGYYHYLHLNNEGAMMLLEKGSTYISVYPEKYMNIRVAEFIKKIRVTTEKIKEKKKFEFPSIKQC